MNLRSLAGYGLVCAVLLLGGCDSGRKAPAKVAVRVINLAPSYSQLGFRREQTQVENLAFKGGLENLTYDVDTYDFYVNTSPLDASIALQTWTFAPPLKENNSYTFVLTEAAGDVVPVVLESPTPPAADGQFVVLHAAENVPAVDLYLERPGVGIGGATPRGSLSFQGQLAPRTIASGEYELWLTAAGNPANVLFASGTFTLPAGAAAALVITPEGNSGTAAFSVTLLQAGSASLYDRNATAEMRVINGAADGAARDIAIGGAFTPPLFSAASFATPTPYASVPVAASTQITVTPVGNQGVFELDQAFSAFANTRQTFLFSGAAGALLPVFAIEDGRHIRNEARIRFWTAASQFNPGFLDFLLTARGADQALQPADAILGAPGASSQLSFPPGDYDIYVRTDTGAIASGPTPVHMDAGGLYGVLAVNGPDSATVNLVLLDDFP